MTEPHLINFAASSGLIKLIPLLIPQVHYQREREKGGGVFEHTSMHKSSTSRTSSASFCFYVSRRLVDTVKKIGKSILGRDVRRLKRRMKLVYGLNCKYLQIDL